MLSKEKGGRGSDPGKHHHLINLGPQTNKEIDSRRFDFGFTNNSILKEDGTKGKKGKKPSISKAQEKKMHHHNRNQTYHEMNNQTINYELVSPNNFNPSTATNHYVTNNVSNSGKNIRETNPHSNTNSNKNRKFNSIH